MDTFDFNNPMNSYNIGLSMCTCCQDVPIEGCTDPTSENYNPEASIDDGSLFGFSNSTLKVKTSSSIDLSIGI